MDSLNDILSSLSQEDINSLKSIAESVFSTDENKQPTPSDDFGNFLTPDILMKISGIMNMMNQGSDNRCKLIEALKPNLSQSRQKKADQAVQILRLLDILPLISSMNTDGDKNAPHKPQ